MVIGENDFLKKYRIDKEQYRGTTLKWGSLRELYNEYTEYTQQFEIVAESVSKYLVTCRNIHSVRSRVKDPEHLIEKIIRKRIKDHDIVIDTSNYIDQITDLIGVRALHLFKSDWIDIHEYIENKWEFIEPPVAYIRDGDDIKYHSTLAEKGIIEKPHENGYRSMHYIIAESYLKGKVVKIELQVRTIFEEGWSEIDHRLRYPYYIGDPSLESSLRILNRIAGSADEMSEFVQEIILLMNEQKNKIESLSKKCEDLVRINDRQVSVSTKPVEVPSGIAAAAMSVIKSATDKNILEFLQNNIELNNRFFISPKISDMLIKNRTCVRCGKEYTVSSFKESSLDNFCEDCKKEIFGVSK